VGFASSARISYGVILTETQAQRFRDTFFSTYRGIRRWHNDCWTRAKSPLGGRARTVFGRLLLPQVDSEWGRFNMLTAHTVSGSCADLIKLAMIKVAGVIPPDCHLVATVHDELVLDVPAGAKASQCCARVKRAMKEAFVEMFGDVVPVEVEAKVCSNWGEK
jgi:DNA polymerase I-like protein with 3'-5' exonuclease and polymerase domains